MHHVVILMGCYFGDSIDHWQCRNINTGIFHPTRAVQKFELIVSDVFSIGRIRRILLDFEYVILHGFERLLRCIDFHVKSIFQRSFLD